MGVWRTVRGRRIYIEEGETLEYAMKKSGKFPENNKWKYPGIQQSVEKIENEVKQVKSFNRASAIRIAIDAQEKVIDSYMERIQGGVEDGDEGSLLTYRRRLRTAKKKLIEKGVL